jgi:hypothetical protein
MRKAGKEVYTVKVVLCGQDDQALRRAYKVLARAALERSLPLQGKGGRKQCERPSTSV